MKSRLSKLVLGRVGAVLVALTLCACTSVGPKYTSISEADPAAIEQREAHFEKAESLFKQIERRPSYATISQYNGVVRALLEDQFGRRGRLRKPPQSWGKWVVDGPQCVDPASLKSLFPASLIKPEKVLDEALAIQGIGVPCVGWIVTETPSEPESGFMPPSGITRALTAVLSFKNGEREWRLYERYDQDEIEVGGEPLELAADFSAALAVFDERCELSDFGLLELLLPEKYYMETGIFAADDHDPGKIPVVFIHGVNSNPFTYIEMVNRLALEKDIRENFEFYFFYYPTGGGWLFTAPIFRESVRSICAKYEGQGPNEPFENMVVIAHSMGGLITRASVSTNPGVIYDAWFDVPIDQLHGSKRNRELVRKTFAYEPLSCVSRVVFMATPHRGSKLADLRILTLISKLIKLPVGITSSALEIIAANGLNIIEGNVENFRVPTSIDELSPNDRTIEVVPDLKFPEDMKVHSIIGARGGNPKSDGIVPYWSSHLDGVDSELIIESGHGVPDKEAAATEVIRILREHLTEVRK